MTILRASSYFTQSLSQMDANGVSIFEKQKLKFSRLAHERNERFGGEFFRAKIIYKELLSAEGHRHYPLREPKCLRMTPDLMLPLGEQADGFL